MLQNKQTNLFLFSSRLCAKTTLDSGSIDSTNRKKRRKKQQTTPSTATSIDNLLFDSCLHTFALHVNSVWQPKYIRNDDAGIAMYSS